MDFIFLVQAILLVAFFATYRNEQLARKIFLIFVASLGVGVIYSIYYLATAY